MFAFLAKPTLVIYQYVRSATKREPQFAGTCWYVIV